MTRGPHQSRTGDGRREEVLDGGFEIPRHAESFDRLDGKGAMALQVVVMRAADLEHLTDLGDGQRVAAVRKALHWVTCSGNSS